MTNWPLICERCGSEQYIGILYSGMCEDCHTETTREKLAGGSDDGTIQSGLGGFA